MDWDDVFRIVGASLASIGGGALIVFSFSSWLGKVWASRILEKEKHGLEKIKNEHSIMFARFDKKRADVIAEIYDVFCDTDEVISDILSQCMTYINNRGTVNKTPYVTVIGKNQCGGCEENITLDSLAQETVYDNLIFSYMTDFVNKVSSLMLIQKNLIFRSRLYFDENLFAVMVNFVTKEIESFSHVKKQRQTINEKELRDIALAELEEMIEVFTKSYIQNVTPVKMELVFEFKRLMGTRL